MSGIVLVQLEPEATLALVAVGEEINLVELIVIATLGARHFTLQVGLAHRVSLWWIPAWRSSRRY